MWNVYCLREFTQHNAACGKLDEVLQSHAMSELWVSLHLASMCKLVKRNEPQTDMFRQAATAKRRLHLSHQHFNYHAWPWLDLNRPPSKVEISQLVQQAAAKQGHHDKYTCHIQRMLSGIHLYASRVFVGLAHCPWLMSDLDGPAHQ